MKARLVLRLALLTVLSMCTDFIAIATLAPIIVIGGPSISDTVFSTIAALVVIACAPFIAALPPVRWAETVAQASLVLRVILCAAAAYCLTQPDFGADEILLTIAALWGARVLANESISRVTSAQCDIQELEQLSIANAIAPALAACAWLGWLHLPLSLLPPASILISCACSYCAVAIVFFFWKELWTASRSSNSTIVSNSVPSTHEPSHDGSGNNRWNLALVLLQTAATFLIAIQFSLALSENYFPPPHPALHRDLLIISLAWISAGIGLHLSVFGPWKGVSALATRATGNRFLLLVATIGLAPLVVFPGKLFNLLFIAISAATACLISIACDRIKMSTNHRWLNASTKSFAIVTTYAVAVYMLFQQPIASTYNQWRTLAAISEGVLLFCFLIWPSARAALLASVSYLVQRPTNDLRESSKTTVYLTDSMSLARAAMAAAQLQSLLVVVTNHKLLNWQPISAALCYLGVRVTNPDRQEFPFHIRDQLGDVVVYWLSTTCGFFEQNSKLIEICFPVASVSRITISAAAGWQPWLKTVAVSKIVPVTRPVSGRR